MADGDAPLSRAGGGAAGRARRLASEDARAGARCGRRSASVLRARRAHAPRTCDPRAGQAAGTGARRRARTAIPTRRVDWPGSTPAASTSGAPNYVENLALVGFRRRRLRRRGIGRADRRRGGDRRRGSDRRPHRGAPGGGRRSRVPATRHGGAPAQRRTRPRRPRRCSGDSPLPCATPACSRPERPRRAVCERPGCDLAWPASYMICHDSRSPMGVQMAVAAEAASGACHVARRGSVRSRPPADPRSSARASATRGSIWRSRSCRSSRSAWCGSTSGCRSRRSSSPLLVLRCDRGDPHLSHHGRPGVAGERPPDGDQHGADPARHRPASRTTGGR